MRFFMDVFFTYVFFVLVIFEFKVVFPGPKIFINMFFMFVCQ